MGYVASEPDVLLQVEHLCKNFKISEHLHAFQILHEVH